MAFLLLPERALERLFDQPLELNFSHAGLTRLVAGWVTREANTPHDLVRMRTGTRDGSTSIQRWPIEGAGFGKKTALGGSEYVALPVWAESATPGWSLLAISIGTGNTATSLHGVGNFQNGVGWSGLGIYEGDGSNNVVRAGTTRDTTHGNSTGIAPITGRRYCAVAIDTSTTVRCAVNGKLDTAGSPAGAYNAAMNRLTSADSARPTFLLLGWRRALSQGEQIEYSARPDQLFIRNPGTVYFLGEAAPGGGSTYNDSIAFSVTGGFASAAQQEMAVRSEFGVTGGFASSTVASMAAGITFPVTGGFAVASSATHNLLAPLGDTSTGYAATADVTAAGQVSAAFAITGGLATSATQVHNVVAAFGATLGYSVLPNGNYSVTTSYSMTPGFASSATGGTSNIWTPVTAASSVWTPVSSTSTTWSN
jgi:hypothetical protein